MTKRKFIIISFHQLSPRWISYFHLDELVGDIDVEYWDCSSWMEYGDVLPEKIERPYCHVFKSEEELRNAVYALPAGCHFRILHRFFKLDWLIEWLYQSRSEFIMVEFIPPSHMAEPNLHQRFSKIVESVKQKTKNIIKIILRKEAYRIRSVVSNDKLSVARQYVNNAAIKDCYLISSNQNDGLEKGAKAFRVNSPDYDQYLSISQTANEKLFKDYPMLRKNAYIVYLDNYFPYHCELFVKEKDWQKDNKERAQHYYNKLNTFFSQLEEKYKMPIVIAAHPTANYSENQYNGRISICYRTAELVMDCYGVVTTSSVSFSFAVLFRKPLILFTSEELAESLFMSERISDISEMLGLPIHRLENIDLCFDTPHRWKRDKYIRNFMCGKETAHRHNVDLLRDALQSILNR